MRNCRRGRQRHRIQIFKFQMSECRQESMDRGKAPLRKQSRIFLTFCVFPQPSLVQIPATLQMAADAGGTWHPLRTILHAYVATDAQAVEHLQHTMATLSRDALLASSHLPKWTARLSSLLQSKEPAARWTGLCLALKTAQLSQAILMECAQAWVTLSLNLLSVGVFSSA
jgi:hypothetical protein